MPPDPDSLQLRLEPGASLAVLVVRLDGDVDVASCADLEAALQEAEALDGAELIDVDLAGITFIDLHGIAPLVRAKGRLGSRLRLCAPSPAVLRLVAVSGLGPALGLAGVAPAAARAAVQEARAAGQEDGAGSDEPSPRWVTQEVAAGLRGEQVLNRAIGVLMTEGGISAARARSDLLETSQGSGVPLLLVAEQLVARSDRQRAH